MGTHTIVQPFFLAVTDEAEFSIELKREFPNVKFVDDSRWNSSTPPVRESIADCVSNYVFLWPSDIIKTLPFIENGDHFDGPESGVVMQFMRSRLNNNFLYSGQIGTGFSENNSWMKEWSRLVINCLRRLNSTKLHPNGDYSKVTGAYVVGAGVENLVQAGVSLRHNLDKVYYTVASKRPG